MVRSLTLISLMVRTVAASALAPCSAPACTEGRRRPKPFKVVSSSESRSSTASLLDWEPSATVASPSIRRSDDAAWDLTTTISARIRVITRRTEESPLQMEFRTSCSVRAGPSSPALCAATAALAVAATRAVRAARALLERRRLPDDGRVYLGYIGVLADGDAGGVMYAATRSSSFMSLLLSPSSSNRADAGGRVSPTGGARRGGGGGVSPTGATRRGGGGRVPPTAVARRGGGGGGCSGGSGDSGGVLNLCGSDAASSPTVAVPRVKGGATGG